MSFLYYYVQIVNVTFVNYVLLIFAKTCHSWRRSCNMECEPLWRAVDQ